MAQARKKKVKDLHAIADLALDMLKVIKDFNRRTSSDINIRIGIQCGPVTGGIVGKHHVCVAMVTIVRSKITQISYFW